MIQVKVLDHSELAQKVANQHKIEEDEDLDYIECEQNVPIYKKINLNRQIDSREINNIEISSDLAKELIIQDENNHVQIFDKYETNPNDRPITPNPYYHYQKRKLLLIYKK